MLIMILYVCKTIGYINLIMYSNVKSTGLPLGLFSTLMFSGNTLVYL